MTPATTAVVYTLKFWLMSLFVIGLIAWAWIGMKRDQQRADAAARAKAARDRALLESMVRMDEYRAKRRAR